MFATAVCSCAVADGPETGEPVAGFEGDEFCWTVFAMNVSRAEVTDSMVAVVSGILLKWGVDSSGSGGGVGFLEGEGWKESVLSRDVNRRTDKCARTNIRRYQMLGLSANNGRGVVVVVVVVDGGWW